MVNFSWSFQLNYWYLLIGFEYPACLVYASANKQIQIIIEISTWIGFTIGLSCKRNVTYRKLNTDIAVANTDPKTYHLFSKGFLLIGQVIV
jgi:hypothetical protein